MLDKIDKLFEKILMIDKVGKFLEKFDNDKLKTPLNPFIAEYYLRQTDQGLDECLENVSNCIETYNKAIQEFKNCLNENNTQEFINRINEQIEDLEYANNTNNEIIIFIGKIKKERQRIKIKKQNSIFTKIKNKVRRNKIESI